MKLFKKDIPILSTNINVESLCVMKNDEGLVSVSDGLITIWRREDPE